MNFISNFSKVLAICLPILIFTACENDDDNDNIIEGTNSIVNYMNANPRFSKFARAVEKVGLSSTFDGNSGSYTFFGPNNEAVELFLQNEGLDSLGQLSTPQLRTMVENHVLETLNPSNTFTTGYFKTMASIATTDSTQTNLNVFIDVQEAVKINENTGIVAADIATDNGIFHEVNAVIKPATLETFLQIDANLNAFYQNISAPEISNALVNSLQDTTSLKTIIVPNANALEDFNQTATSNSDSLEILYNYHFLDEFKLSTDFNTGYLQSTVQEGFSGNQYPLDMYLNTQIGLEINGASTIVISDIVAINGILHISDAVLKLPTLATFIQSDRDLTVFNTALDREDQQSEGFMQLLAQDNLDASLAPFTVFAPNDTAFEEVLTELYPEENAELQDIPTDSLTQLLKLHIIPETNIKLENFTSQSLSSLTEEINLNAADTSLTDPTGREVKIEILNAQSANGSLQKLKRVLLTE